MGLLERLSRVKALRAYVGAPVFEASRAAWSQIPAAWHGAPPIRGAGSLLQSMARLRQTREQSSWTCFLRNRAEIAYLADLGHSAPDGGSLSVAIFGCSTGAEAFSTAYALRDSLERIAVHIHASDICPRNIEAAALARYEPDGPEMEGLSTEEKAALFATGADGRFVVREHLRRPIGFSVIDAMSPGLADRVGLHDVVLANKFLCHMPADVARRALRNLASTVRPGGVLLVSGVDLEVRASVARELALIPEEKAIEAMHEGDLTLRRGWPFEYWGLEPLDRSRSDFAMRYAAIFIKPGANPFARPAPAQDAARVA